MWDEISGLENNAAIPTYIQWVSSVLHESAVMLNSQFCYPWMLWMKTAPPSSPLAISKPKYSQCFPVNIYAGSFALSERNDGTWSRTSQIWSCAAFSLCKPGQTKHQCALLLCCSTRRCICMTSIAGRMASSGGVGTHKINNIDEEWLKCRQDGGNCPICWKYLNQVSTWVSLCILRNLPHKSIFGRGVLMAKTVARALDISMTGEFWVGTVQHG